MLKRPVNERTAHRLLDRQIQRMQTKYGITTHISGGSLATMSISDKAQMLADINLILDCEKQARRDADAL